MNAVEILEQALSEAWEQYPGCKKLVPESLVREALAALEAEGVGANIDAITQAIRDDEGYAISWHANIAMAYQDEGGDHATANRAAARFMQQLFGVDTSSAIPLPGQSPEPVPSAGLREAAQEVINGTTALTPDQSCVRVPRAAWQDLRAALRAEEG